MATVTSFGLLYRCHRLVQWKCVCLASRAPGMESLQCIQFQNCKVYMTKCMFWTISTVQYVDIHSWFHARKWHWNMEGFWSKLVVPDAHVSLAGSLCRVYSHIPWYAMVCHGWLRRTEVPIVLDWCGIDHKLTYQKRPLAALASTLEKIIGTSRGHFAVFSWP